MSFSLADLLISTPKPQKAAGAVVAAPAEGEAGAFAEALAAFRAGTVETKTGEAGIVLQAATASGTQTPAGVAPAANVLGLDALIPADPSNIPPRATAAPVQAIAGSALPADAEQALSQLLKGSVKDQTADSSTDTAADGSQMVAGLVVPATPADIVAANFTNNADMALRLAGGKSLAPPTLDTPENAKAAAAAAPASAASLPLPLQEGRASVAGPPPLAMDGATAPALAQDVLDAIAPRAPADAATVDAAMKAAVAQAGIPAPAANVSAAPAAVSTAPVTSSAAALVPDAVREIASTPNVVSVQGAIVARDKPAADQAPAAKTNTASSAATSTPSEDAAVPARTAAPAAAAPVIPAPETALSASPATQAEAADGALAVLTKDKDKPEAKPVAAQPAANPAPAAAPDADADAAKPVSTETAPVKTADAKPDDPAIDKKPDTADKPAAATEPRTAQPQAPVTDKPILADAAAKAQQQANSLPAAAIPQIASEIATRFKKGATRFEIRLDPPELGRVDVRIDVDTNGRVTSRLMVEKTETLDLLKADQRALERALNDAGFKSEQNSLSFSLRDDRGGGSGGQAKFEDLRQMREQAATRIQSGEEPMRLAAGIAYRAAMRGPGGFDLRV